jgi:hypothetical protein
MAKPVEKTKMDYDYENNVVLWDHLEELFTLQLSTLRERKGDMDIGLPITILKEAEAARLLTPSQHLDWWRTGFYLPRQSGGSRWISSKLKSSVMVIVGSHGQRENMLCAATEPYRSCWMTEALPPTTSCKREELEHQVINWELAELDAIAPVPVIPEIKEALSRVQRVYVWWMKPTQGELEAISTWVRQGGKVPEILVFN